MDKNLKYILKLLFSLLFFFCFSKIVVLLLNLIGLNLSEAKAFTQVIYQFIMTLILFGVLILIYIKDLKKDFIEFKKDKKQNIKYIIKMFFMFMIIKFGVSFLSALIMVIFKIDTESLTSTNQTIIENLVASAPLLMAITTGFVGPVYEEVLFRLGFRKVIKNKTLFIIISGLIFGLMHIFPLDEGVSLTLGLIQSISYVSMGFVLGYVYTKTNNIFTSIGIHFLNNFLSVIVMISMI